MVQFNSTFIFSVIFPVGVIDYVFRYVEYGITQNNSLENIFEIHPAECCFISCYMVLRIIFFYKNKLVKIGMYYFHFVSSKIIFIDINQNVTDI